MTVQNINVDFHCQRVVKKAHSEEKPAMFVFTEKQLAALEEVRKLEGTPIPGPEVVDGEVELICNARVNTYAGSAPFEATCPNCGGRYRVTVEESE